MSVLFFQTFPFLFLSFFLQCVGIVMPFQHSLIFYPSTVNIHSLQGQPVDSNLVCIHWSCFKNVRAAINEGDNVKTPI